VDKYRRYSADRLAKARGRSESILSTMFGGGESHAASVEQQGNSTIVKSRRSRCVLGRKDTEDGPLCVITPEESGWYRAYVNNFLLEEPESFMAKKFRNRFRLPYPSYKELLHQIVSDSRFERWCGHKWNGKKLLPVQLLLLGSLRYLGRGWTFDDIEEQTVISVSVHRKFLVSDWDGDMGRMDFDGLSESIPNSIARLSSSSNLDPRNYDISNMGSGEDVVG
jgi:hypothetical protein